MITTVSCTQLKAPDYKEFKNFRLENMGMGETVVAMDLVYYNPNNIGFEVKRTEADVYVENIYLGKAVSDTLIKIAKRSDFIIPIRIKADMKNLYKNAWSAFINKSVLITAKGTITAGKAGIFKTIPLDYEGRHEISLFIPNP
jgi:LEA14-like dessication related protein